MSCIAQGAGNLRIQSLDGWSAQSSDPPLLTAESIFQADFNPVATRNLGSEGTKIRFLANILRNGQIVEIVDRNVVEDHGEIDVRYVCRQIPHESRNGHLWFNLDDVASISTIREDGSVEDVFPRARWIRNNQYGIALIEGSFFPHSYRRGVIAPPPIGGPFPEEQKPSFMAIRILRFTDNIDESCGLN